MSKLIDSTGTIIAESSSAYIEGLYQVLTADVYSVSEQDEVEFGKDLYLEWQGELRIEHDG